jgi:hypothetical protein
MTQHHFHLDKLTRFSIHLEELFSALRGCRQDELLLELADEIAATAGEIMLLLASHDDDELVRAALADARRLRESARTVQFERARLVEAVTILSGDLERIIREEKRAA